MASPRERDHRSEVLHPAGTRGTDNRPFVPILAAPSLSHVRRHHFHDVPPWPHQHYHDYALVEGWGWWPRWYPYWDPQWRAYWWHLYDYYGGDGYPEYAEYARDAMLRANAPQWGLVVSGYYNSAQPNIQSYGGYAIGGSQSVTADIPMSPGVSILPSQSAPIRQPFAPHYDQVSAYRRVALDSARKIAAATGGLFFGYRDSPWGSELSVFGTRAGLQRWANEQAVNTDVWYAATFDLSSSALPLSEVSR
jgi:hypothetical protein